MLRAFICRSFQSETIVIYVTERVNVHLSQFLWSRKLDTAWQWACLWSPVCRAAGRLSEAAAGGSVHAALPSEGWESASTPWLPNRRLLICGGLCNSCQGSLSPCTWQPLPPEYTSGPCVCYCFSQTCWWSGKSGQGRRHLLQARQRGVPDRAGRAAHEPAWKAAW